MLRREEKIFWKKNSSLLVRNSYTFPSSSFFVARLFWRKTVSPSSFWLFGDGGGSFSLLEVLLQSVNNDTG